MVSLQKIEKMRELSAQGWHSLLFPKQIEMHLGGPTFMVNNRLELIKVHNSGEVEYPNWSAIDRAALRTKTTEYDALLAAAQEAVWEYGRSRLSVEFSPAMSALAKLVGDRE